MPHEPVGNMESVIRKLERFELPKSLLLHTYQNILKAQLRYELKLNEKAFSHKDMHKDEIKLLHIRNQKIRQAESYLKESETKQIPELDILKVAAIYFHCPLPQTHEYINGETALTFADEPDLFALTNLVTALEPLARQKDANPQFVKYFSNLQQKKSQVLLDESLRNSLRQGVIGIKFPKVKIDLLHEGLPKVHISRPNLTGIVRDYVTVGSNVSQYDKQFLKETLIDDVKSFLLNTKLFKTNYKNSPDITSQLSVLVKKIDRADYVIGADEINEFINLTKDHPYFQPDKKIKQINVLIEDTGSLNFDSIRTKKAQKKMNSLYILSQLVSLGSGGIYNQHQKFAETMNHVLSQADGDPLRPYQAISSVVGLGQQFLEHRGDDPAQTVLTYLENPDHVRPVASYLLYDYFESLQNFPEKDRERLVGKATNFITEVATRYQSKSDQNHDSLVQYLTNISEDPEMQDLLGYTVLPFLAYTAENEDSFAREQWLSNAAVLIQKKEYSKLVPYLDKAFTLISNYDPDNIKINFDNPASMQANGETITIPQNITDALNALPPNPNYLPPDQFMETSQKSYIDIWHNIYGKNSSPPQIYWDPLKEQPEFVTEKFQLYLSVAVQKESSIVNDPFSTESNQDWFTKATVTQLGDFTSIYGFIPSDDPYKLKFQSPDLFLKYYQDYVHFVQSSGSSDKPVSESDLFGYALVKCNGNSTEATKEISLFYKFVSRYDLNDGKKAGNSSSAIAPSNNYQDNERLFFQTVFLSENLPILLSITDQTDVSQELNKMSSLLLELDKNLNDQKLDSDGASGFSIGSKDVDLADLTGLYYHKWSQKALVFAGVSNPTAVALDHSIREFPLGMDENLKFIPNEGGSSKGALITLGGVDDINLRHYLQKNISNKPLGNASTLSTIYVLPGNTDSNEIGKITNFGSNNSAILLPDPENKERQIIYYGPTNLIKLISEKGYAPANFSSDFNLDGSRNTMDPELLNFFLSSGVDISGNYFFVELYPEADQLKVAQILLDHKVSIFSFPSNLDSYLKLGLDVPNADIVKMLDDPNYYSHIVDALPFLATKGLVKSDNPLVKYAIENSPEAIFDYYSILSPDDQFTLKKLNPELELKLQSYAISNLDEMKYDQLSLLNRKQLDIYFSFLIHGLKGDYKDTAINDLNFILPYLTADQLELVIQNPRITEKNLSEIFDSGRTLYSDDNNYPDLSMRLKNIESIISDRSDLLMYFTPALLKGGVWNLEKSQEKIDSLISQNIKHNNFEFLTSTYIFSQLQEAGYQPSEELANQLVESSISLIKSHPKSYYQSGIYIILGHFASPEQFTTAMDYLANLTTDDAHGFANQLFSERFGQYSSYNEQFTKPINQSEKALLNELLSNDNILPFLGDEGGLLGTYYSYADNLTEANAHRLYDLNLPDLSEMERYKLVVDMNKHNFHPPAYVFDHDKFIEQIYVNYTSERFYIFDSSSNDFVKDNLTYTELFDIFKFVTTEKGLFDMYLSEDYAKVFNHDYFKTISGYTPALEKEWVSLLISQLSLVDMENVPSQSYFLIPYIISQQPDFDYGPYFVAWITDSMWNIKNIVEDNPTRTKLFIETARQIKTEYWDEIRANDLEKYNYLQNLITSSKENIDDRKR